MIMKPTSRLWGVLAATAAALMIGTTASGANAPSALGRAFSTGLDKLGIVFRGSAASPAMPDKAPFGVSTFAPASGVASAVLPTSPGRCRRRMAPASTLFAAGR